MQSTWTVTERRQSEVGERAWKAEECEADAVTVNRWVRMMDARMDV